MHMDIVNHTRKVQKKRRRLAYGGVAAAVIAATVAAIVRFASAMPAVDTSSVWIDTVKAGDMVRDVRAQGTLVPLDIRWVSATTEAVVVKIEVLPGIAVKADTTVMTLSNPDVEDAMHSAEFDVAAAKARVDTRRSQLQQDLLTQRSKLAQAQANYESAKVKADVDTKAIQKGLIPRFQYEQEIIALKQLTYLITVEKEHLDEISSDMHAQMGSAEAEWQQKVNALQLQRRRYDALRVQAGIDGVLQEVVVQEGQRVIPGANLARVAKPDVLIARLRVPEIQAKDMAIGKAAEIDTYNGMISGQVSRVDPAVVDGTVKVDIALTGPLPPGARPDLSIEGVVHIDKITHTLYVGRPAQPKIGSNISLFKVDPSGNTATRVPVELGAVSANSVQVISGLVKGDKVIISDSTQWQQYQKIRLK